MRGYADGMVLTATRPGTMLAFRVSVPLTDEDLRRLAAIQEFVPDVEWTGREEGGVR